MKTWNLIHLVAICSLSIILFCSETCTHSVRNFGKILPGFQGSQMNWIDNDGLFLLSNNSDFAFGFQTTENDFTLFLLVVMHRGSTKTIWTANRGSPVSNSDKFVFNQDGKVLLQRGGSVVWSIDTNGSVSAIGLQDSGNLVLLGDDDRVVWETFSHPTDTLISNQNFTQGMRLVSNPSSNNLSYFLEIKSGDVILSAGFLTPQPYWSMGKDERKTINKGSGEVTLASLSANSWRFYDKNNVLLWQFIFADNADGNATWIAVLANDGSISFYKLQRVGSNGASTTKIPKNQCSTPEPCDPYYACSGSNTCQCPTALSSINCKTGIVSPCDRSKGSTELVNAGDGLNYFALRFVSPSSKTDLDSCKASCLGNCSCHALFFQNSSRNCFMFDRIGSFQSSGQGSDFVSYIKVLSDGGGGANAGGDGSSQKRFPIVVIIVISTLIVIVIAGLLYLGFRYYQKKRQAPDSPHETSEEASYLQSLSMMPLRFSYQVLQNATSNFSDKLGQGGFGSVYRGVLPDGTPLAVKKLEGNDQGEKEYQAEVRSIGRIHHHHLLKLKGFCAEGTHRLLVYEYMANNSLDKWIFKRNQEGSLLDWETRYKIAVGTAKGLAYLHEDCDAKIIHCDIKPENVLLDDNFEAKVADFGMAKLMKREQSRDFTTPRGTRGYLAPEWIRYQAISEKIDVYSFGKLLLEIVGGRKNFDRDETSEKTHFPIYAFKMMEEGKLNDILDSRLKMDEYDGRLFTAVKVALWCIQEDEHQRPAMSKVVQMLEGICPVPQPPNPSPPAAPAPSLHFSGLLNSISEEAQEGTSSGPSEGNSGAYLSAECFSGPR